MPGASQTFALEFHLTASCRAVVQAESSQSPAGTGQLQEPPPISVPRRGLKASGGRWHFAHNLLTKTTFQ